MLDETSSDLLAVYRIASCYIPQMKPIEEIRRENFAALVAAEPSQAAFARKVRKDKNQVSQWLGRAGSRNISAEIAREIEAKCGKARGWMDRDWSEVGQPTAQANSQPARLDPEIVGATAKLLRETYEDGGKRYDIEAEPDLFAIVYERLSKLAGEPKLAELVSIGRAIGERRQGAIADDNDGYGGADIDHTAEGGRRAAR